MLPVRTCWPVFAMAVLVPSCIVACVAARQPALAAAASAQQQSPPTQPAAGKIVLDVVVAAKSGEPVSGLQQQDFTLLDNKVPQSLASFQAVDGRQASIEVILLLDTVNIGYENVAYERNQISKFLVNEKGRLAHPTALAVLTDKGVERQQDFSTDGEALNAALDRYMVALRTVNRNAGFWGADERIQVSLAGFRDVAEREASRPGRKLILCLSPGWPLLSGPEVELSSKGRQQIFENVVDLSNLMLQGRITLYSIDPLGANEAGSTHVSYWENFVKGVSKPSQAQAGDLAVEVLATQSGGVAFNSSNDITSLIQKSLRDTAVYYELSFNPAPGEHPHEYHHLEIHIGKPGLTARTRQGYYSPPWNEPGAAPITPLRGGISPRN